MEVYRITSRKYGQSLDGIGASKWGGRWNSPGMQMVYCSGSRALACLELLVHNNSNNLPHNLVMLTISIPDLAKIKAIDLQRLPDGWDKPDNTHATQDEGDLWLMKHESLVLQVPSAVIVQEANFLLNPYHAQISGVKVLELVDFRLDERLGVAQ